MSASSRIASRTVSRLTAYSAGELALGRQRLPRRDDAEPDGLHEARHGVFEGVALAHRPVDGPAHLPQRRVGHGVTASAACRIQAGCSRRTAADTPHVARAHPA